jgi:beta-glucanase (GH16 family)
VGDWIWPAMWLLPEDQAYGQWPASGEIDLMESRGNAAGYAAGGVNCFGSTLHFGPFYPEDPYELAHADKCLESGTLADDFHTYGLVWTESEIYTYLDTDANKVLNLPINSSFWERGGWNKNAALSDPWRGQPDVAPFDQKFYLVFNVAVGGVSGYFPDASAGNKPWSDKSSNAAADFNNNLEAATKTWDLVGDNSALQIRSVKVWQE